jgi:hypothetical protein
MPHKDYQYFETAGWGNEFDKRKTVETNLDRESTRVYEPKLRKEFGNVLQKTMAIRSKTPWDLSRIQAVFGKEVEGAFIANHLYDAGRMKTVFDAFGVSFAGYQAVLDERTKDLGPKMQAAKADTEAYIKERESFNQPYTTKSTLDPGFEARNLRDKGKENTGRYKPLKDDHSWVVSIVRAGQIDPSRVRKEVSEQLAFQNRYQAGAPGSAPGKGYEGKDWADIVANVKSREKAEQKVLDKYGLEPMPGTIEDLWPGAIEFWEARGAFK